MKKLCKIVLAVSMTLITFNVTADEKVADKGTFVGDYQDWRLLSVSHRLEKNSLRAILGNDAAIIAARSGKTLPWPDGSILAKVAWKEKTHPNWQQAIVPEEFVKAEAMVKDSKKYAETGGWGFGHWEGKNLLMYDKTASATCFACHGAAKDNDHVFTHSALKMDMK